MIKIANRQIFFFFFYFFKKNMGSSNMYIKNNLWNEFFQKNFINCTLPGLNKKDSCREVYKAALFLLGIGI